MKIKNEDNFCRVFQLPDIIPNEFCFGGPIDVTFKMVDWFCPLPTEFTCEYEWTGEYIPQEYIKKWNVLKLELIKFCKAKTYIQKGKKYILITDFGESVMFDGD